MSKLSPATQARLDALSPEQKDSLEFVRILVRDGLVAFLDGPLTARRVVFSLHMVGIAIAVRSPDGAHLGLFASPTAAALHGFDFLDREAEREREAQLDSSKPHPRRVSQP